MNMRKTKGAKVVAVGFISLTLLGNYWMILAALSGPISPWLYDLFILGAAVVFVGAVMMVVEMAVGKDDGDDPDSMNRG